MRTYINSDIYANTLNKGNVYSDRIRKILSGTAKDTVILNNKLDASLSSMKRVYRETSTLQVIDAINSHRLLLFITAPEANLPVCLPFVKYAVDGVTKVAVNLTNYITSKIDEASGNVDYDIDIRKLHALALAGFMQLTLFDDKAVLPADALNSAAILWARLFNKVLEGAIGLGTNRDRYDAFMYLAIKFFLKYYMETPDQICNDIADKYLKGTKNSMLVFIEENIRMKDIDIYASFSAFCTALFNNEITNIKGIKLRNVSDSMNELFYQKKFVDMYYYPALLSLASFPYLIFTVLCAEDNVNIVNFKVIKKIIEEDKLNTKLLNSLYKEIR